MIFRKAKKNRKFSVTDLDKNLNNAAPWSSSHPREAATVQEPRSGLRDSLWSEICLKEHIFS